MPPPILPTFEVADLQSASASGPSFPPALPHRPAKPSRFKNYLHNKYVKIVVGVLAILSLIALAAWGGAKIEQAKHKRVEPAAAPTVTLQFASTAWATATEVVPTTLAQSTTLKTIFVPKPTVKCAGGAASHPECQVD